VRGLSAEFGIAKPAVSRALDALRKLGFAKRKRDPADRRSVLVERTVKGSVFLSDFAATIEGARRGK
jgi:DNA-binding MarR family transcriptional regulator